jgi:phosphopantothenoylcysteine decarboxylase/phosphopantothenate--cysteine ligase
VSLRKKHILLGITGGIAAYKSAYLVRELVKSGAEVRVVMTDAATKFVQPLTFSTLSNNPVAVDLWDENQTTRDAIGTKHVHLANWADAMLVAPASANSMAKLVQGAADNLLTVLALACTKPILLSPAMDADMMRNDITRANVCKLRERGFYIIPPEEGEHASGLKGPGRLPEVGIILSHLERVLANAQQDLKKKMFLVTAGPTYEAIDPVRYIGNRSSGKMGYAIANAAAQRGAAVILVSGPTHLETPRHVQRIDVESAEEMQAAVLKHAKHADAIVMSAAVADFMPERAAKQKIKKDVRGYVPEIKFKRTPDILESLANTKAARVGFALETHDELAHAKEKLKRKNLDLIVLNSMRVHRNVFGSDENIVTLIGKNGKLHKLPKMSKFEAAEKILDRVRELL